MNHHSLQPNSISVVIGGFDVITKFHVAVQIPMLTSGGSHVEEETVKEEDESVDIVAVAVQEAVVALVVGECCLYATAQ